MRIAIVGPGRLGRSLNILLTGAGHTVTLFGRDEIITGDPVVLCVPDGAIASVAAAIAPGPVLLHCSGAADLDVLRPHSRIASMHPLMTFPGPEVGIPDLTGVPAAIAGDGDAAELAEQLARSLGMAPFAVSGDRRLYHAAAVLAGNFGTVLLEAATQSLIAAGAPRDRAAEILLPLALESLRNAPPEPARALTGPVARGDEDVIAGHRKALTEAGLSEILEVYDALTRRARSIL